MRVRKLAAALTVALLGVMVTATAAFAQTYQLPSTGTGAGDGVAAQFPTIALVAVALVGAAVLVGGVARRVRTN